MILISKLALGSSVLAVLKLSLDVNHDSGEVTIFGIDRQTSCLIVNAVAVFLIMGVRHNNTRAVIN